MNLELELKKLGFSDKEAKVYLALLELGGAPVQEIAKKARVNRATTYVVLDALRARGLVSTVEEGKKVNYAAEHPNVLSRLFQLQQKELQAKEGEFRRALPELEAIFNVSGERPRVRFFEGKEGAAAVRDDIVESGVKELLDIYPFDYIARIQALFSEAENAKFLRDRQERGITIRTIYSGEKPFTGFTLKGERRFLPQKDFPFSSDILIYGNRVAFTTLKGKIMSVIVESQEIADTFRLVFELAWRGAGKNGGQK